MTFDLLTPLGIPSFRRFFVARTIALVGSGLTTIALSLLAYDLVGGQAGIVLGSALALKMLAYVGVAPAVGAFADRLPRRAFLVLLDVLRAGLVVGFAWVSDASDIYLLIFLLSACAAGFTPIYQAAVPDLLRDSAEYTKGLALSRVSYDLEGLVSPSLSTMALLIVGYPAFFVLNGVAFLASALLVGATPLPPAARSERPMSVAFNLTFGVRSFLATPRLRGLLAAFAAVAIAGAMVIVNTVVIVRDRFGGSEADVALAFAASGAGSLVAALGMPTLLDRVSVRSGILAGAAVLPLSLVGAAIAGDLLGLMAAWFVAGVGMSLVQTPAGRVIEASCNPGDRSAYFAAHFALSHAAWLIGYPLAGWVGAYMGLDVIFAVSVLLVLTAALVALVAWPRNDPEELWHVHEALEHSHVHGSDAHHDSEADVNEGSQPHPHRHEPTRHRHRFVIDAHHPTWPK